MEETAFYFAHCEHPPNFPTTDSDHGWIEICKIWVTTELNNYLNFPHVGQACMVERLTTDKKSGKEQSDIAYGITSKPPDWATAKQVLQDNRGHWALKKS